MRLLYDICLSLGLCLTAPYYFWKMWRRGNWRSDFGQRFGNYGSKVKQALTNRDVLWIHAVSVGEVNICTQLIHALEPAVPNLKIVVSTTTSTGMGELRRKLPSHIEKIYYPIDRRRYVDRALQVIHPVAVVLIEAELWPNFLWSARRRGIPVFLVNARLSPSSYRGYRQCGFLFRPLFAQLHAVGAQNSEDADRLRMLGCREDAIHVVGSLKYDAVALEERRTTDVPSLLAQLGVPTPARILLGGSTHSGEEALLAECYLNLRREFPDLFLVLVPRHFERGREVGRQMESRGLRFFYRSEIGPQTRFSEGQVECLIVNTTGELRLFYQQATVVFVGKSLTAAGGQNPIEPAALGKPMVFGPHMENFAAIAQEFVQKGGAIQVQSSKELAGTLLRMLSSPALRESLGKNAMEVVQRNRGSIERTVDLILSRLRREELYIAPHRSTSPVGS